MAWGGKAVNGSSVIICNHQPTLLFDQIVITNYVMFASSILKIFLSVVDLSYAVS